MPLILSGNVASATAGAYEVANSCRFNNDDSARMSKTPDAGNRKTMTFSAWVKIGNLGIGRIFSTSYNNQDNQFWIKFNPDNTLGIYSRTSGTYTLGFDSAAKYRDISGWYHLCVAIDTTQSTAGDRFKPYVNGSLISGNLGTVPALNLDVEWNVAESNDIGGKVDTTNEFFDGYMAEVCFIDGLALAPTSFGEFDEDSPTIWKPIDVSGLTFGTNGFYLDFEDSGDLDDDESGNGNDFTASNLEATDQAQDSPTNNFATANSLNVNAGGVATFAEGNTSVLSPTATGSQFMSSSTLGMTAGKWYCEAKIITVDSMQIGISAGVSEDARDDSPPGVQGGAESISILVESGVRYIDDGGATHGAATSANGIMMFALDLDNNNFYAGTGGQWFDGDGNADESSPNSAIAVTAVGSTTDGAYFFSVGDGGGSATAKVFWNFGNPPYANSSSVSDANGYGDFEYTVPSGYLALCTKNLGSDGG